jgi:uncharacterized protein YqjF (DUF2071 family)
MATASTVDRWSQAPVAPVFLTAAWRSLVMLNFEVEPHVLAPHVPKGTELDLWQDRALVSLVGFQFWNTCIHGWAVPCHSSFDEVNLRFYVRRETPDGWRRGVVFLKEVVARPAVTLIARRVYNENYITRPVSHDLQIPTNSEEEGHGRYRWGRAGEVLDMSLRVRGVAEPLVADSEAEFITEHYWGYTRQRDGTTLEYAVQHPQWKVWLALSAELRGDPAALYGAEFAEALRRPPCSAFLVDGSDVVMRRGVRIGEHPGCSEAAGVLGESTAPR